MDTKRTAGFAPAPMPTPLACESTTNLLADVAANDIDSYDEDLVWILERLVDRTGGALGLILRYQIDQLEVVLLARSGEMGDAPEVLLARLSIAARSAVKFDRRRRDDFASMSQLVIEQDAGGGEPSSWRMLCLSFTAEQEKMALTLYPVLARYVRLWWLHRTERRRANALGAALELADVGVLLLDRRGEVLFSNAKATALLASGDGLQPCGRSVTALEFADGARFQAAIQHAIHCNLAERRDDEASRRAPMLSLKRRDKRPLITMAVSVGRLAIDSQDPTVIVYVLDPEHDMRRLLAPVCGLYKLNGAETRLVCHLIAGMSLAQAAVTLKIQQPTARTYLKQVFAKTQTNRQSDLMRLMLSSLLRITARVDLTFF